MNISLINESQNLQTNESPQHLEVPQIGSLVYYVTDNIVLPSFVCNIAQVFDQQCYLDLAVISCCPWKVTGSDSYVLVHGYPGITPVRCVPYGENSLGTWRHNH